MFMDGQNFFWKNCKKYANYVIIRTRFFDKKIKFDTAATDIYTSMMEVRELVKEIFFISTSPFKGIINIDLEKSQTIKIMLNTKRKLNDVKGRI